MDRVSNAIIHKALDGLNQRAAVTAQNIANANTPDYRPVHIAFEEALRAASTSGAEAIDAVSPQVLIADSADGARDMRLDLELAMQSQTAMRYRALLDMLGRQMALHRAVVSSQGR